MLTENIPLVENGCALHWLAPKGKNPVAPKWSEAPIQTLSDLKATKPAATSNIGIRLGKYSKIGENYLHFIDADIRVPGRESEPHAVLDQLLPGWQTFPKQISGSGGASRHIAVLLPEAFNTKMLAHSEDSFVDEKGKKHWAWEIELLGTGKQAVLAPSIHPDTGKPYVWEKPIDWEDIADGLGPIVPLAQARSWQLRKAKDQTDLSEDDELRNVAAAKPKDFTDEQVAEILATIPYRETYGPWLEVGMALHHQYEGGQKGLKLWLEYSRKSKHFNEKEIKSKWDGFASSTNSVTVATLKAEANAVTKTKPANSDLDDDKPAPVIRAEDLLDSDEDEDDEDGIYPTPTAVNKIWVATPGECENSERRGYVVKGMIAPKDVFCIFGAPGAGKSLISPLIGYAVAQGEKVFGMRTKPGKVLYVAAEDDTGMKGRIAALRRRHGDAPDFMVVGGVSDLFAKDTPDYSAVLDLIKTHQPQLVFVDTLAMAFPGLEENDAQSMGRVVAISRKFTKYGAAVGLIHHDTKSAGGTPRGHSVLNGALDAAMWLQTRDEFGIIRGKLTKNRNGPIDKDIAFKIEIEEMGIDEDGDPITYALASETDSRSTPNTIKLSASERAMLKVFMDMLGPDEFSIDEETFRQRCIDGREVSSADRDKSRMMAFRRAYDRLLHLRLLSFHDGLITLSTSLRAQGEPATNYDPYFSDDDSDLVG